MGLLNLTLVEFLSLLIPLSGFLVALYFYDRSRRRQIVSTLQFWPRRAAYPTTTRRKKLQQPWSLLLQLLATLLLLLAIADWRFDITGRPPRRHVLIIETSALMRTASQESGGGPYIERVREKGLAYLRAIPQGDLVMVIRADANPIPATRFTADRDALESAIRGSEPGWTAVNLGGALELARSSLQLAAAAGNASDAGLASSERVGEVAYIGSGRVARSQPGLIETSGIPRLRYIDVGELMGDLGIRRLSAHRDVSDPQRWQVVAEIHNSGSRPHAARVNFSFEDQPLGYREIQLAPDGDQEISFSLRTQHAGSLAAELASDDHFTLNNRAGLDLPAYEIGRIEVYSANPDLWRTLVAAAPGVRAAFRRPDEYQEAGPATAIQLFDGFAPRSEPGGLYFNPPAAASPIPVLRTVRQARITRWASHPLADGIESRDVVLDHALVFKPSPNDVAVARTSAGPVIVARSDSDSNMVVVGFHPSDAGVENQLLTPLLFAKILHWLSPDMFRSTDLRALPPGVVEIDLESELAKDVALSSAENPILPWSVVDGRVRFYVANPGEVQVRTPHRRLQFALNLPEMAASTWEPPERALRGVPPPTRAVSGPSAPLWPWLALAALACLVIDWRFFARTFPPAAASPAGPTPPGKAARTIVMGLGERGAQVRERQAVH